MILAKDLIDADDGLGKLFVNKAWLCNPESLQVESIHNWVYRNLRV